ncbi:MAG: FtsW/RodA/SpoVE family cell cycle protein, partial [Myxococcota bacterium]|nr:FtsW/RodA/SpoVE family cell cycle protein [Myxococcota bacterium]
MNRSTDLWIVSIVALLLVLGVVMVYSASAVVALEQTGDEMYYFTRQMIAATAGITLGTCTALTPMRVIRRYRVALYMACLFGLV